MKFHWILYSAITGGIIRWEVDILYELLQLGGVSSWKGLAIEVGN